MSVAEIRVELIDPALSDEERALNAHGKIQKIKKWSSFYAI